MNVFHLIKYITDNNCHYKVLKFHCRIPENNPFTSLRATAVIHEHLAQSARENLYHPQCFPSRVFQFQKPRFAVEKQMVITRPPPRAQDTQPVQMASQATWPVRRGRSSTRLREYARQRIAPPVKCIFRVKRQQGGKLSPLCKYSGHVLQRAMNIGLY